MAKNENSWRGAPDARPCSSTNPDDQQKPRDVESLDWKGTGSDSRPKSGTDQDQKIGVGGGKFSDKGTSGPT